MRLLPTSTRCIARRLPSAVLEGHTIRRFAHGPPPPDEPTGYFLGEKPPPPGQKRIKEPWENVWLIGMFGSMAFATVMLYYKPDTSIETWALAEAERRMQARGEKFKYEPSS